MGGIKKNSPVPHFFTPSATAEYENVCVKPVLSEFALELYCGRQKGKIKAGIALLHLLWRGD